MTHELPELGYEYDALEPVIDTATMEIHHSKHHQAYTDKLNAALEKYPELQEKEVSELLVNLEDIPEDIRQAVINHGGGYVNHTLFWEILKKDVALSGEIKDKIENDFGSFEVFKTKFTEAAGTQFGSGWAWLVYDNDSGKLEVMKTANQDSPLSLEKVPILGLDVWEHAYYLNYQNKRPAYIEGFFEIINWDRVNELLASAKN